jgi:hypothetical protein
MIPKGWFRPLVAVMALILLFTVTDCKEDTAPKLVIVSFNLKGADNSTPNWRLRVLNFAQICDTSHPSPPIPTPAVISLQHVYEWSDCNNHLCNSCKKTRWGKYLNLFIDHLRNTTGIHYKIATNLRSKTQKPCLYQEMKGEAILYNPDLVNLVPLRTSTNMKGCLERRENLESHYGHNLNYNDCFPKDNDDAYAARAVFEFPKDSGAYFSLYNTGGAPCRIVEAINFIYSRQQTLEDDLKKYFRGTDKENNILIHPPILTGDMNPQAYSNCSNTNEIFAKIRTHFVDAPHDAYDPLESIYNQYDGCEEYLCSSTFNAQHRLSLELQNKVWVGRNDHDRWDFQLPLTVLSVPRDERRRYLNTSVWHGSYASPNVPNSQGFSAGYSPVLVEISANPFYSTTGRHDCSATTRICPSGNVSPDEPDVPPGGNIP